MAVLVMPVKKQVASYEFTIQLEKVVYLFRFRFNFRMGRFLMDIASRDGVNVVAGIPLLYGVDLIGRFRLEGLPPGAFMINDSTGQMQSPNWDNFGSSVQLVYIESGTIES